ncbi:VanZ family protein [Arthrobacter sp. TMN-50]
MAPIFLWSAVAASAFLGWLLHRFGKSRALLVLACIGLIGALALTVTPSTSQPTTFCLVHFSGPFQGIEPLANVAMLLPLTLFAALGWRRPLPVLFAVSGLSALIEIIQALTPSLGRTCDTNDWFMNTLGAAIGTLLAAGIGALETRRRRRTGE